MMVVGTQGRDFAVDQTGQRIWGIIGQPCHVGDVVAALCAEYDGTEAECAEQTLTFLESLRAHGLAVEAGDGGARVD